MRTIQPAVSPAYPSGMPRVVQVSIAIVSVLVICIGANYNAVSRENLRDSDLNQWYQQINQEHFGGKLKVVPVYWATLPDGNSGMTDFSDDDQAFSIELDVREVATKGEALQILKHEMCHVKIGPTGHGSAWQACMDRF